MIRLSARALSVTPPGAAAPVVAGVDLDLAAGEWVALTGPNGGGKSSIALALAGLWPFSGGTLTLDREPFGQGASARRRLAFVGQDPSSQLLQGSVRDEIAFALRNLDVAELEVRERVARWAGRCGLTADLRRDPRELSAGRQQLVLLAAALALEPDVLIADEAAAHLDDEARRRMLALVRERTDAGLAVLWVTQEEAEARAADREIRVGEEIPAAPEDKVSLCGPDPSPAMEPRLEVRVGPDPGAGRRVRLPGLSRFSIGKTGVTVILGPNGSGKTVLLEALAGLHPSDQIRVMGTPVEPPPILAGQHPETQVFEEAVGDELAFGPRQRGVPEPEVQRIILQSVTGVTEDPIGFLARRTWSLSSGERRLVGVLAALLTPAGLVLLDEPSAGLDPRMKRLLAAAIRQRSRRTPVVLSSQDPGWALGLGTPPGNQPSDPSATPSCRQKTD